MRRLALAAAIVIGGCSDDTQTTTDATADSAFEVAPNDADAVDALDTAEVPDGDAATPDIDEPDTTVADRDTVDSLDALETAEILDTAGTLDTTDTTDTLDTAQDTAPPREHGLERRVVNTTCFLDGTPPLDIVAVGTAPTYPSLATTADARALIAVPHDDRLALVEATGHVRLLATDGADNGAVLDISDRVRPGGLVAAAYRPDGGALVVSYLALDEPLRLVVASFPRIDDGIAHDEAPIVTLALTDPDRGGGGLAFLFDGTLVVALGDGGNPAAATDPGTLAGKALRYRLDDDGLPTGIPDDNPDPTGAYPEIYASGFANPTSCTVDRVTGRLWCADTTLGADRIAVVNPGALAFPIDRMHSGCALRIGFVSRDAALPDIQGALVYGDACSPELRALRFDGSLVRAEGPIATLPAPLAAFGEAPTGELRAVYAGPAIGAASAIAAAVTLVRPATPAPRFPTTVSATGCLASMATREPAPSLIPFEVRTPLWSDGAKKRRFIVLPGSDTIGFTPTGSWQFPDGTMFMKEFLLDDDDDETTPPAIMETRFFVKRSAASWEGYSYMWDRDKKDAFLLDGAEVEGYAMAPGAVDESGASTHRHTFPDRTQCLLCHNAGAGRALGLQTGRMNTDHDYDGFTENQLAAMDYVGLFSAPLPAMPDAFPRFPDPRDAAAPVEGRARSWLYANCAHCHQPGGSTPVAIDLRYETPLSATSTCGRTPKFAIAQIPDAQIINPGNSANSELFFRLSRRDRNQMPPIATLILDNPGVDAVRAWIDGLTGCDTSP